MNGIEYVRAASRNAWDMSGPPTMFVPFTKKMWESETMVVPVDVDWGARMFAQYEAEDDNLPFDEGPAMVVREFFGLGPARAAAKMLARPDAGWATFVFPVSSLVAGRPSKHFIVPDEYTGDHALLAIVIDRAVSLWDPNGRSPFFDPECSALADALSAATGRRFTAAHDRMRDSVHTWGPQQRAGERNGYCQSFALLKAEDIVQHGYPGKMEATMAGKELPEFVGEFKRVGVPNIGRYGDHICPWAATHGPRYSHDAYTAVAKSGSSAHVLVPVKDGVARGTPPVAIGVYGTADVGYTLPTADELVSSGALAAAMDHPSWPQPGMKSRFRDVTSGDEFMEDHTDALPKLAAFVRNADVTVVTGTRRSSKGIPKTEYTYTANGGKYPFSQTKRSSKPDKVFGLSSFLDSDADAWDVLTAATATGTAAGFVDLSASRGAAARHL